MIVFRFVQIARLKLLSFSAFRCHVLLDHDGQVFIIIFFYSKSLIILNKRKFLIWWRHFKYCCIPWTNSTFWTGLIVFFLNFGSYSQQHSRNRRCYDRGKITCHGRGRRQVSSKLYCSLKIKTWVESSCNFGQGKSHVQSTKALNISGIHMRAYPLQNTEKKHSYMWFRYSNRSFLCI